MNKPAKILLVLCMLIARAASAADTNPLPRLTVELRDGSRVVGDCVEKLFKFRSSLFGDLKLSVKDIRTIECTATNTAKLTTVNGDTLTVAFLDSALEIKTGFGKVELATGSIRKFTVSSGGRIIPRHEGLVALWSGNGNAKDAIDGHDGTLMGNVGFGAGQFGEAFRFDSPEDAMRIAASPDLNVGQGRGITLEAWINPTDVTQAHPLFEWNNMSYWGVHFHIAPGQPFNDSPGPGELYANIPDANGGWHQLSSSAGAVVADQYQLVALTYDRASGVATIYCNGKVVGQRNFGSFTPLTTYDLYLGKRLAPSAEAANFAGLLDEVAIYNRALTAAEIREDYEAGNSN